MPISTSSFEDDRDSRYAEYEQDDLFDQDSMDFPGLTPPVAEGLLKRLGGGVSEKNQVVEGIGWKADIVPTSDGVAIQFTAHDELIDDLMRRFEEMAERVMSE